MRDFLASLFQKRPIFEPGVQYVKTRRLRLPKTDRTITPFIPYVTVDQYGHVLEGEMRVRIYRQLDVDKIEVKVVE